MCDTHQARRAAGVTDKLKPCPFCGGEAVLVKLVDYADDCDTYTAECHACDYWIGFGNPAEMAARWNTRPSEDTLSGECAAALAG